VGRAASDFRFDPPVVVVNARADEVSAAHRSISNVPLPCAAIERVTERTDDRDLLLDAAECCFNSLQNLA
jgi:hypothetical protein